MKTLRDLFIDTLADIYDAEHRITEALPKMAEAAGCAELRTAFENHLEETEGHVTKVESVFALFDESPRRKTCEATKGLLKEGDEVAGEFMGSAALDAALICSAQKVEHYEMATYGCLATWAGLLGYDEAQSILHEILSEEEAADEILSEIATSESNEDAMHENPVAV
ncbi:MAG TPA: ferritin-like domain-containing protein [Verrucomicrobiales bacterium]|jgi:ferritin-like metal-binding protein YciE|nr:ferritin-like domain-containing protein [Verrucomicrobiales bacterium]